MTSELQRDIAEIEAALEKAHSYQREDWKRREAAWQRLKPRLTPDRERVADAIWNATGCVLCDVSTYKAADAAIAAMGETP